MNDNLVPISEAAIAGIAMQTVNARDLHAFLKVVRDFNQWMRDQIQRVRLVADRDYVSYEDVGNPSGGRPRKECALTLDAAKHIAMMSGTERGFEIREYFIACEQKLRAIALPNFNDPAAAARAWADELDAKRVAQAALEKAKPAVEFVEKYVEASSGSKTFREVSKLLGANEARFREFLVEKSIVYYLNGSMTPFAGHLDAGRFSVKAGVSNHSDHVYNRMTFTPKGVTWIAGEWGKHLADLNQQAMQRRPDQALSHAHH